MTRQDIMGLPVVATEGLLAELETSGACHVVFDQGQYSFTQHKPRQGLYLGYVKAVDIFPTRSKAQRRAGYILSRFLSDNS